jgi:hypothetical protein
MNQTRKTALIALFILAMLVLWLSLRRSSRSDHQTKARTATVSPSSASQSSGPTDSQNSMSTKARSDEVRRSKAVENVLAVLATPITFYGRVLDQNGNPVSGADVDYGAIDKFDESGTDYHGKSDANGNFSIHGIKGAVLTVGVRKTGYYNIHGRSDAAFAYGVGIDPTRKVPPTKENPALFVLQKQGPTEPLIRVDGGQIDIPSDGQPLNVDLATGRTGTGNLRVQTWIENNSQRRFDWHYELSVPGGGLIERPGQFDFEAPEDGYQPALGENMFNGAANWSARPEREYFAKLPDGRFARFAIHFYAGDRNFIVFTSYLNPEPGHRNLEFDPTKQIKVK